MQNRQKFLTSWGLPLGEKTILQIYRLYSVLDSDRVLERKLSSADAPGMLGAVRVDFIEMVICKQKKKKDLRRGLVHMDIWGKFSKTNIDHRDRDLDRTSRILWENNFPLFS